MKGIEKKLGAVLHLAITGDSYYKICGCPVGPLCISLCKDSYHRIHKHSLFIKQIFLLVKKLILGGSIAGAKNLDFF